MDMDDKTKSFLAAVARVTRVPGRVFRMADVCRCLQWDHGECGRLTVQLQKEGLLNRLPGDEGILTTAGSKAAGLL